MSMTDELIYVSTDRYCPVCGSSDIEGDEFEFDTDSMYNRCHCNECDSRFTFGYWVKDVFVDKDNKED